MKPLFLLSLAFILLTGCEHANDDGAQQHDQNAPSQNATTASPYVADTARTIKALSPEQVAGYLNGDGMGFAMAAELNHYPGPKHVLELADLIELSDAQRQQTQAIYDAMRTEAQTLGRTLVDHEAALDALFANSSATRDSIHHHLDAIATTQAALRFAHLNAHLDQRALLTQHQVMLYDQARGYGTAAHDPSMHNHH